MPKYASDKVNELFDKFEKNTRWSLLQSSSSSSSSSVVVVVVVVEEVVVVVVVVVASNAIYFNTRHDNMVFIFLCFPKEIQ